jgi:hypothetical protein
VIRTGFAVVIGAVATLLLSCACILGVVGTVIASPEHPGRLAAVALSVPELRAEVAEELVSDAEERVPRELTPVQRAVVVGTVERTLAAPEGIEALREVRVVDGRQDLSPVLRAYADHLRGEAGLAEDARTEALLDRVIASLNDQSQVAQTNQTIRDGISTARGVSLAAALVFLVVGLLATAIAAAVARRGGLATAVILSGSLLMAGLALGFGDTLLGATSHPVGAGLAAVGQVAGTPLVALLLIAGLVPVAVWAARTALASRRHGR